MLPWFDDGDLARTTTHAIKKHCFWHVKVQFFRKLFNCRPVWNRKMRIAYELVAAGYARV